MHNVAHVNQQQPQSTNISQSPQPGLTVSSLLSTNPVSSFNQSSNKVSNNSNENATETLTFTGLDIKSNRNKELSNSAATIKSNINANSSTSIKLRKETTLPTISVATTIHEIANKEQQNLLHLTNYHLHSSSSNSASNQKSQHNFASSALNINSSTNNLLNIDKIREAGLADLSNLTFTSRVKKNYISSDYVDNKEYKALKPHNHNHNAPKIFQFNQPYISGGPSKSVENSSNPNLTITATNPLNNNNNMNAISSSNAQLNINSKGKFVNLTVKPPLNLSPNFNFLNNEPKNMHRQTAFASYYASLIEQTRSLNNNSVIGGEQTAHTLKKHRNQLDRKSRINHKKGLLINTLQVSDLNDLDNNFVVSDNHSCNGDELIEISSNKITASSNRLVDNNNNNNLNKNKDNNDIVDDDSNKLSKKIIKSSPKLLILKLSKNKLKSIKQKNEQFKKHVSNTTTLTATNENNVKNKEGENFIKQSANNNYTAIEVKTQEVSNDFHSTSTSSCFINNFRDEQTHLKKRKLSLPVSSLITENTSPSPLYQKLLPSLTNIINTSLV